MSRPTPAIRRLRFPLALAAALVCVPLAANALPTPELVMGLTVGNTLFMGVVEQLMPRKRETNLLRDPQTLRDLGHGMSIAFLARPLAVGGGLSLVAWLAPRLPEAAVWPSAAPMLVQVFVLMLLWSFCNYWLHRAFHAFRLEADGRPLTAPGELELRLGGVDFPPDTFREPLEHLTRSLEEDAGLHALGRTIAGTQLQGNLEVLVAAHDAGDLGADAQAQGQFETLVELTAAIERNPQAIIASGMGEARPEWLDEWRQWGDLDANRFNNLLFVNPDHIY